jgi:hypothetical protein
MGELTIHRGEMVEVLDELSPTQWQVKNRFGGVGIIPVPAVELVIKKKPKSKQWS